MNVEIIDTKLCTGCMSCELACSFHHIKSFTPSRSSIEVVRNEETGEVDIQIHHSNQNTHLACDGCVVEKEKQCVKYCSVGVIV